MSSTTKWNLWKLAITVGFILWVGYSVVKMFFNALAPIGE